MIRRQPPIHSPLTTTALWDAIRAGGPLRSDPRASLTQLLAGVYRADHVVLLGSGTQALQVALEIALRHASGSAVALPAFTCFDVAAAAVGAGAQIALYDLDPVTLSPDPCSLDRAVAHGAQVAVITPLYGFPVDRDAIEAVLARHGAIAVEDAAQGFRATWRGCAVGSLGPLSVLSFGRGKGWTGGAGGALLLRAGATQWDADRLSTTSPGRSAELTVLLELLGQWALCRPRLYGFPAALPWLRLGETVYRPPRNPRAMTRAAAACLEATRSAAEREAAVRTANGAALLSAIRPGPCVQPVRPLEQARASFLRLPVRLRRSLAGLSAEARVARLGVLRAYPSVLATLPQVRARMNGVAARWPGAAELVSTLVTVPTHSLVTAGERSEIVAMLNSCSG